jgi:uncharacterized protein
MELPEPTCPWRRDTLPPIANKLATLVVALTILLPCTSVPAANNEPDTLEPIRAQLRLKNFSHAAALLKTQADNKNSHAAYLLGTLYRSGLGVPLDTKQARQWIETAAAQGDPDAAYAMAAILADEPAPDDAAIERWLERAAKAGHFLAVKALKEGIQPLRFRPDKMLRDAGTRSAAFWLAAVEDNVELLDLLKDADMIRAKDDFGRTALAYAARHGSVRAVALLLRNGASADQTDTYGITPMMLAAGAGHGEVIKHLLEARAPINSQDRVGNTALMYAVSQHHEDIGLQLLAAGAEIKSVNVQGWSALDWALRTNSTVLANRLRDLGLTTTRKVAIKTDSPRVPLQHAAVGTDLYRDWPDILIAASRPEPDLFNSVLKINANTARRGPNGETPLLVAIQSGNTAAIESLLSSGTAKSLTADGARDTPVSWAVRHNKAEVVQLLLNHGLSPDAHGKNENAPLLDATRLGNQTVAKMLLTAGARTEVVDDSGRTPLMLATQTRNSLALGDLLASGANYDAVDKSGRTALWLAAAGGADDCAHLLINVKANLEKADNSKISPLMVAAAMGNGAIVDMLLSADASAQEIANNTALLLAAANGHEAIVKRLLSAGARPNLQNDFGDTALISAVRAGQASTARALLAAGANADLRNKDRASALDIANRLGFKELATLLNEGA